MMGFLLRELCDKDSLHAEEMIVSASSIRGESF